MAQLVRFQVGDIIVHPKRPEWGEGLVQHVSHAVYQGRDGQRVTLSFKNYGRAIINSAAVTLIHKKQAGTLIATNNQTKQVSRGKQTKQVTKSANVRSKDWANTLGCDLAPEKNSELYALPEALTDPFASLTKRLKATLDYYRYDATPKGILEWAIAQTGLHDPLGEFSRQRLEDIYDRFVRNRDAHLKRLVMASKKEDQFKSLREAANCKLHPDAKKKLAQILQNS